MIENILADCSQAYGLSFYAFRYFNAAGADPSGRLGERHHPETHLIPIVLQAASGRRPMVQIFGRDYSTPDGTCVRDFVHVEDIVEAHMLAMHSLRKGGRGGFYNLGSDTGYSVKEVIDIAREVTGRDIRAIDAPSRQGDPAFLVADATKARDELGWRARYDKLETIIEHAWRWELQKGKLW
jgi:UDP-glucose 4-epimerase